MRFTEPFIIGRHEDCQCRILDTPVSRQHAEVAFEKGQWWVRDLDSTNGTFLEEQKIDRAPLPLKARLQLGKNGPALIVVIETPRPRSAKDATDDSARYFSEELPENAGEHTLLLHQAFKRTKRRQFWKYTAIIAAMTFLAVGTGFYAWQQHQMLAAQKELAKEIFYDIKQLELKLAALKQPQQETGLHASLAAQNKKYDLFIEKLGVNRTALSEEEMIIYRMARVFGECELEMPKGFVQEVRKYIKQWQASDRLPNAIRRAQQKQYFGKITESFLAEHLPPQFFYLALQESNFRADNVGPDTRYGIAKGMWQFIPETAHKYDLRTGPLLHLREYDPRDERHDFEKSTRAASQYIRDLYDTLAQASGLLVLASYNWGEGRVIALIESLPQNPRERNFWRLMADHRDRVPQQTYDFVLLIFSAAVIGENPRLFGFDFDNPLASIAGQMAKSEGPVL